MVYSTMRKLLPLAVLALAACSAGGVNPVDLIQPDVRLHHLAVRNVGLSGGTLDVVMAFHNPNHITLKGTSLSAGLDIEGNHFGDVALTNPFSLAGRDTTLLTLPLTFRWSGLAGAARSVLDYGAVNYAINGKFSVNTPAGAPLDVPFSGQGNVPLLRP
jgi:LEA14-like dessication related protein